MGAGFDRSITELFKAMQTYLVVNVSYRDTVVCNDELINITGSVISVFSFYL